MTSMLIKALQSMVDSCLPAHFSGMVFEDKYYDATCVLIQSTNEHGRQYNHQFQITGKELAYYLQYNRMLEIVEVNCSNAVRDIHRLQIHEKETGQYFNVLDKPVGETEVSTPD